jgi:hypothetical protein
VHLSAKLQRSNPGKRKKDLGSAVQPKSKQLRAGNGSNGTGAHGGTESTPAQALWRHAEQLAPKTPWRAVARAPWRWTHWQPQHPARRRGRRDRAVSRSAANVICLHPSRRRPARQNAGVSPTLTTWRGEHRLPEL